MKLRQKLGTLLWQAQRKRDMDDIHVRFYDSMAWGNTRWRGVKVGKCAFDMLFIADLIHTHKPDHIWEMGTAFGGSALYYAEISDAIVHSVDIQAPRIPCTEFVRFYEMSSLDNDVRSKFVLSVGKRMLLLDSDHSKEHVLAELQNYCPLMKAGELLVVEDTNVNGNPVFPQHGAGPNEAVEEYGMAGWRELFSPFPFTFNRYFLKEDPNAEG